MAQQSGFNAVVVINGQVYGQAGYEIEEEAEDCETNNSQGITGSALGVASSAYKTRVPGQGDATVRIRQATFDTTQNPYQVPYALQTQAYAHVRVFPAGLTGVSWDFFSLLILGSRHENEADRMSPLSFEGKTDGFYKKPIT